MAFVPVANTVMVESVYELDGQVVECVSYWEFTGEGPTLANVTDLLQEIRDSIQQDLLPVLTDAIKLVRLIGTLLTAVDSLSHVLVVSPPIAGGINTGALPSNVAYCVGFSTALRGRSFRGRNFVPGLPATAVTGNTIVASVRTSLLDYYTTQKAAVEALGWEQVVVSRIANGADRIAGVTTPVTAFVTFDPTVDSQRRRLPGRGR